MEDARRQIAAELASSIAPVGTEQDLAPITVNVDVVAQKCIPMLFVWRVCACYACDDLLVRFVKANSKRTVSAREKLASKQSRRGS